MNSHSENNNPRWLKEHFGSECKICGKPLDPRKWYTRLCIERMVFIPTLMIIIFGLSFLSSDPEIRALPFLVPAVYVLAYAFMGVHFKETFQENEVPAYAFSKFSVKTFYKEGIAFLIIFVVLGIAAMAVELYRMLRPD